MSPELEAAARKVLAAIDNEGPMPSIHRKEVAHLQEHWPTLWNAIQELRHALG